MTTTKNSLLNSTVALLLCFAMLLGTTFAWFTDAATSSGNVIQTGNLKVDLLLLENDGSWRSVKDDPSPIYSDEILWEPGYTDVKILKVANKGSLALKWVAKFVSDVELSDLAEVIDVYVNPSIGNTYPDSRELDASWQHVGTLDQFVGTLSETTYGFLEAGESANLGLALKMQESADNDYQDKSLGEFTIQILATQAMSENDSFGNNYDENAAADFFPGFQGGSASVNVALDDQGATISEVAMSGGDISAVIPAGVSVADSTKSLGLTVTKMNGSGSNIQLSDNEVMSSLDVHMDNVADGNTTAMIITLKHYLTTGLNAGALKLYHVENGVNVAMTHSSNPTNHNEFYYDPLTGDLTLAMASFSEVMTIADTNNPWDGETLDYTWYINAVAPVDYESETVYTIANADQLAAFATIVDGTAEGIPQDSFAGKTVKLNNNIYLSNQLFEPIGWGYEYNDWNVGDQTGKPFKGTFDGNNKTIFDLYQNGWDLINAGTGEAYTYTNCGFGLFAAASNATFKNLTISGAYVRVECVEAGVLVGLSQNSCNYENIKILNSKIANYQRPAGGLIGEVSGDGTTQITDVTIGDDVVVGSLWGDFDAPVGGVIGAYWNDVNADPQIKMTNVDVGCRLDVYNDITSAYQWHAYRRAGMLIGNTDMSDPNNAHKAYAPFLKCENVKVYYSDWVNYTYCEFSTFNPRYPWVRTQVGENCEAFSNPRWGVPNDKDGNRVTDMNHVHYDGEECGLVRQFSQLYGGGQGVYGQDDHEGVTYPSSYYTIKYVNDSKTLDIVYVTDNSKPFTVGSDQAEKLVLEWAEDNIQGGTIAFGGWMNAASIKLTEIPAKNDKNIVLYPYFNSPYTASFVDQDANILAWCLFNDADVSRLADAFTLAIENAPNPGAEFTLIYWKVKGTDKDNNALKDITLNHNALDNIDWNAFKKYKDVTITPHYQYNGADLIEVYDELTGEIDHYQVAGYKDGEGSAIVEIPAYVNGKPVIKVNDGAFKSYDDIYAAVIPGTITHIGSNAFTEQSGTARDQVTLYYAGDPKDWKQAMDALYVNKSYSYYTDYNTAGTYTEEAKLTLDSSWDSGAGDGSRIFFLDENGKVDLSKGYWELYRKFRKNGSGIASYGYVYTWVFHDHPYDNTLDEYKNCSNEDTHYGSFTDYDAADRPDQEYWIKED